MSRRVAVLIASSRFPHEPKFDPLVAPERDVDALSAVLAQDKGGVFDEVLVLKNLECDKVRRAINRALRTAAKDDQVLLYYSGHGKLDPTGKLCLAMTDTVLDELEASSIRIGEIKDFLDGSRCKQVMLMLDCCYSGAVGKDFVARNAVDDQLQVAAEGAGICIMSAANAVQTALENVEQGMGVFTKHVIAGIASGGADHNGDGWVTFDELYEYVQKRVLAEGHQRPQRWAFQAEGSLVIARSGNWDALRRKLRAKVLELANAHELPDDLTSEALAVLGAPKGSHTREQTMRIALLEDLESGKTKPASFTFAWAKLAQTQPAAPERPAALETSAAPEAPLPAIGAPSRSDVGIWPIHVDFGRRVRGEVAAEKVKVWRHSPGPFDWRLQSYGDFFEVDVGGEGLTVTLVDAEPGQKQGLIKIESNVGAAEIEVRARLVDPPRASSPHGFAPSHGAHARIAPPMPHAKIHPGRWLIELTAFGVPGAKYTVDLAPDGSVGGSYSLWGVPGRIQGAWSFDPSFDRLILQIVTTAFGVSGGETLQIQLTGQQGHAFTGTDPMMRGFTLTRVGELGAG